MIFGIMRGSLLHHTSREKITNDKTLGQLDTDRVALCATTNTNSLSLWTKQQLIIRRRVTTSV